MRKITVPAHIMESTQRFLERATRALHEADAALQAGSVGSGVGRAYYAMVYAAKALINERGLRPQAHAEIASGLRKHFTEAGLLDGKFQQWFDEAKTRKGSTDETEEPTFEESERLLEKAREFVGAATRLVAGGER